MTTGLAAAVGGVKVLFYPLLAMAVGLLWAVPPSQAAVVAPSGAAGDTTTTTQFGFQGDAFGTTVTLGRTVKSGRSAPVVIGCTNQAGISKSNTTANVNASPVLTSGTVFTTAKTFDSPVESRTSATVEEVNLLSGAITATAVRAQSSTSRVSGGFRTSGAGTSFVDLRVLGETFTATPAPNTRIELPGLGFVILNEQKKRVGSGSASLTVNAIHVVINQDNNLDIAKGTEVIVSHARSGLRGPIEAVLDGFAYGTSVKLGNVLRSGPSFRVVMPCFGTNGKLKTNTGAGVTVPDVLSSGTIRNTAQGTVNATSAMGETTATVERANVLDGLVKASVIKAAAQASKKSGTFKFGDAGSDFGSLSVRGFPRIDADVERNTKLNISGLGTLFLHRVIRKPNFIEVRMIELIVKQENDQGLPVGSVIRVAVAHASAH